MVENVSSWSLLLILVSLTTADVRRNSRDSKKFISRQEAAFKSEQSTTISSSLANALALSRRDSNAGRLILPKLRKSNPFNSMADFWCKETIASDDTSAGEDNAPIASIACRATHSGGEKSSRGEFEWMS